MAKMVSITSCSEGEGGTCVAMGLSRFCEDLRVYLKRVANIKN